MLPSATFEMRKHLFNPLPGEAYGEHENILKTYKLFIYGDMTQYYKIVLYKCAVF
jgi:hypothetical protein